ncbi:Homeobox protein DBX1 [Myotis davidii]|uniref:Homeobox protein DBX1 n=1 Tax=Myotis davidii TaxID=225400 RepID=L5MGZ4_MYODS|nr:Homeobox protein DBX1 [Myotis davidii]
MMFPGLLAPPAGYPSLLRPTPTLTLPQSLQSAFSGHSSFLVEDLIRISRPPAYLPRSVPTASMSPPRQGTPANLTDTVASDLGSPSPGSRRGGSPQTAVSPASEPTFLKFGVNAILSSAPRNARRGLRRAVFSDVQRKALEKMFQKQKYISKPDRKKLAAKLGLKDSQRAPHSPALPPSGPGTHGCGERREEWRWRASPAHSSSPGKPSDFSDSEEDEEGEEEEEEITVS